MNDDRDLLRRIRTVLALAGVLFILFSFSTQSIIDAEFVGDDITVPITFSAGESVTAADFTVSVSGGTILNLTCGGSGFSNLSSSGNNCVVFNPTGATSGTIATALVRADSIGTLTVLATGTLSTAGGTPPASGQINGASYTITASSATPTPTPTSTSTPIPTTGSGSGVINTNTPTSSSIVIATSTGTSGLPQSGAVTNTVVLMMVCGLLTLSGTLVLRRV